MPLLHPSNLNYFSFFKRKEKNFFFFFLYFIYYHIVIYIRKVIYDLIFGKVNRVEEQMLQKEQLKFSPEEKLHVVPMTTETKIE